MSESKKHWWEIANDDEACFHRFVEELHDFAPTLVDLETAYLFIKELWENKDEYLIEVKDEVKTIQ